MVLVTSNKRLRLLCVNYIGVVTPGELERHRPEMKEMLANLPSAFRLLADFSALDRMEAGCEIVIGQIMEEVDRHGVEMIVRVIPDGAKDIGMNILTLFHYAKRPRIATCANLAEAARVLAL